MSDSEYKEKCASLAKDIKPIVDLVDKMLIDYDIEELREIVDNMRSHNSSLAAWPFPGTMAKAEMMSAQTDLLEKIIDLLKFRKAIQDKAIENMRPSAEDQVLKLFGM